MTLLDLSWVTVYFLYVYMVLLRLPVLYGLYPFFFPTYGVSFSPLEIGYKATKVYVSGWIEYFGGQGMYWVLFNLGRVNQWFQYNNLKVYRYVQWSPTVQNHGH